MHFLRPLSALALLISLAACGPPSGHITFSWSFAGERSCTFADVADVEITVLDDQGETHFTKIVPCTGSGRTLFDFDEGQYTIVLDAFSYGGDVLFRGEDAIVVHAGAINDAGIIRLDRVTPPPPGDLAFYWVFDGEPDCFFAGVWEVDVTLLDDTDRVISVDTYPCEGSGLILRGLEAGAYGVLLDAYSRRNRLVYQGGFLARVRSELLVDVGDVWLDPVY